MSGIKFVHAGDACRGLFGGGNLVDVALLVEAGEAEGVLEAVRETQADLLVVGLRPHDRTVEFAGTLRRIASQIHCPVLAVPSH